MNYEKKFDKLFLAKWKYQAKYAFEYQVIYQDQKGIGKVKIEKWRNNIEENTIKHIDLYLRYKSTGDYIRKGNIIYVVSLTDIFNLRLFYDHGLQSIIEVSL